MAKVDTTQTLVVPLSTWGRLAANSTAHMVEHLFNGVIAVILPLITTSLGLSLAQAGALASARTLMAGAASFPSGFLADLGSRRNLFLGLCLGMIGLSCLGLSTAWSFVALLIFMGLGGAGGGGFHPQSLAILSAAYREKRAQRGLPHGAQRRNRHQTEDSFVFEHIFPKSAAIAPPLRHRNPLFAA